ncbi:MAG: AI-2E family transporter, partial [Kineothrix sp.]|nr:AI-2E family transporter [Kineothrix sp.]
VVPRIMNESVGYVKNFVGVVSFLAIMIIAAVLLAKDYTEMMRKLYCREEMRCVINIGKKIFRHIGTFIRAQFIILLIISLLCGATLFLGGFEGGIAIGLFTGFMDMLPFIGTGLVLMPLAFWQILNGYYAKAVICVILYVVCALTREFLEPKLIGERMGIFPVAILFSVYAGVKLFGVFGIVKGPLALITIYEVYLFLRGKKGVCGKNEGREESGV